MFHECDNTDVVAQAIASAIAECYAQNRAVLVLLAGGSATKLYKPLRSLVDVQAWQNVTLTLTDERYGIPGHADANWPTLASAFDDCGAKLLPVLHGKSPAETALDWQHALHQSAENAQVLALLGVGTDSHTSGIKPHSSAATEQTDWVASYQGDDFARITTTPAFFPYIDNAFVYLEGADKRPIFEALQNSGDATLQPMQNIKLCKHFDVFYNVTR